MRQLEPLHLLLGPAAFQLALVDFFLQVSCRKTRVQYRILCLEILLLRSAQRRAAVHLALDTCQLVVGAFLHALHRLDRGFHLILPLFDPLVKL